MIMRRVNNIRKISVHLLLSLSASLLALPSARAFPNTQCAADRFGSDLNCNANDVSVSSIAVAPGSPASCVGGQTLNLDLDVTVNTGTPTRWDIGVFLSSDGKDGLSTSANGGASSCSVATLPFAPLPFSDEDGDGCGDVNQPPTSGVLRMSNATVLCSAAGSTSGNLVVPFVVTWDNKASPAGGSCNSIADPVPNTKSKCNSPTIPQTVAVVVTPAITKTDGTSSIVPGVPTIYTVVITNTTGIAFTNAAVFTDPAVANLNVSSVTCLAAAGASCPASVTVAGMQGAGLTLPAFPNGGSLTFTITASVPLGVPVGTLITNSAFVTVNGQSNSASDTDTVAPSTPPTAAISVTPACLFSGDTATFVMTVTNNTGVTINTITPSALTKFVTGAAAIGAFTGPSPASIASLADGASGAFTWTAPVTGNVNDTYYVEGYATSASPAFTTATATSNTENINGYVLAVSPASTNAGSTTEELVWSVTNYGCGEITDVLINVPASWTASTDGYAAVTNTLGSPIDTWTFAGTSFASDNPTNNVQQGSSGNKFYLLFSNTPSLPETSTFNITVTDSTGTSKTVPTTVTVNPYSTGILNNADAGVWQESY
jgi:hypothetical protein